MSETGTVSAFHIFHRWTQWSVIEERHVSRLPELGNESAVAFGIGDGLVHFTVHQQTRTCTICGAQELRRV